MAHAEVNGQELYYEDSGGDGAVILFSHGFLMDADMFAPQVEALAPEFRCVAWDQRGFGLTRDDGEPFTYWDSAADAIALLDALGVERAVLAGMSQGGFVVLRAALTSPERVRGLVLLNTQAGTEDEANVPAYEAMVADWEANGPVNVGPTVAGLIIGSPEHEQPWLAKWDKRPREALRRPFETLMGRDDITDRLGEISAPTLVVHGVADQAITMDRAELLCERLADCRGLVRVEGAAHAANLTHPEAVNPPLREFLVGLE